ERAAGLYRGRSKHRAPDRLAGSLQATCWWPDRSPKPYLKSGPPRRRDRGWRLEYLLAPRALAARTQKTAIKKTPIHRLVVVSYSCSLHVQAHLLSSNPGFRVGACELALLRRFSQSCIS